MSALPLPDPPLRDALVALRPWTAADLPAVVAACQDPAILRFIVPITAPYGMADAEGWLAAQEPARRAGVNLELAVTDARAGELLGAVGLMNVERAHARASIGYWVAPAARRRGVASAAVRLLSGWALGSHGLGLARLELITDPDNAASQRVAASCGYVREGVLRSHLVNNGERRDSIVHSLLAGESR